LANVNKIKDPAEENEELRRKLDESNKKMHSDLNAVKLLSLGVVLKKFLEIEKWNKNILV